ncbi:MAG: hypothetical protein ACR2PO_08705 [Methyloligellaceae bacterium]
MQLPDGGFRLEMTDAIELPRDAGGDIDVEKATASVQAVVEGWVREHPDQWIWIHRRWRFGRKTRVRPAVAGATANQSRRLSFTGKRRKPDRTRHVGAGPMTPKLR